MVSAFSPKHLCDIVKYGYELLMIIWCIYANWAACPPSGRHPQECPNSCTLWYQWSQASSQCLLHHTLSVHTTRLSSSVMDTAHTYRRNRCWACRPTALDTHTVVNFWLENYSIASTVAYQPKPKGLLGATHRVYPHTKTYGWKCAHSNQE